MNFPKIPQLNVWQQAFLHAFLVWFFVNLYDTGNYAYRVATRGYFYFMENGDAATTWERFVSINFLGIGGLNLTLVPFLVELNYHKVLQRKGLNAYLGASLLLAVGGGLVIFFISWIRLDTAKFFVALLYSLMMLAYSLVYAQIRYAIQKKIKQADAITQKTQAELDALKAQLNPHFFFNTLNNLYGTALEEKAEKTAQSVAQLSGIMRYVLTEAQQNFTEVTNEISFLQDYLQLQRMRLSQERENITIQTNLSYDGQPTRIAPLLLIPFIENAFKYGLSLDRPCYVNLDLTVKEGKLGIMVENKVFADRQADQGVGTGIAHVKKRLQLLYPGRHTLKIEQNGWYKVHLWVDLR